MVESSESTETNSRWAGWEWWWRMQLYIWEAVPCL